MFKGHAVVTAWSIKAILLCIAHLLLVYGICSHDGHKANNWGNVEYPFLLKQLMVIIIKKQWDGIIEAIP